MARRLADVGWCWCGDPRALDHAGVDRRAYVGWIDRRGDLTVASFDHGGARLGGSDILGRFAR